jgi:hypothetical protein
MPRVTQKRSGVYLQSGRLGGFVQTTIREAIRNAQETMAVYEGPYRSMLRIAIKKSKIEATPVIGLTLAPSCNLCIYDNGGKGGFAIARLVKKMSGPTDQKAGFRPHRPSRKRKSKSPRECVPRRTVRIESMIQR